MQRQKQGCLKLPSRSPGLLTGRPELSTESLAPGPRCSRAKVVQFLEIVRRSCARWSCLDLAAVGGELFRE